MKQLDGYLVFVVCIHSAMALNSLSLHKYKIFLIDFTVLLCRSLHQAIPYRETRHGEAAPFAGKKQWNLYKRIDKKFTFQPVR